MKTKTEQVIYLLISTIITMAFILLIKEPVIIGTICSVYVASVGTFLGVDLRKMISDTRKLPVGSFKPMNKWRYVLTVVLFVVILVEAFIVHELKGTQVSVIYTSCGVGLIVVLGLLMSGIEANKVVTPENVN